jgi:two-component system sensor histidine kinase/response regulator
MKTILIVDDDEQQRGMLRTILVGKGYQVIEADSGVAGLALAKQFLPDLILSDIHMPGGDGSTLLRDIRNEPELKSKQVVLMTGRPDLVTPRMGMEEGADDFLVKPVHLASLLACLKARFSRASVSWRVEDEMLTSLRSNIPPNLPHEFFTPMAGIIGLMEILRADKPSSMTPEELEDIHDDIYNSALRLNRTLKNYLLILDLSTIPVDPLLFPLLPLQTLDRVNIGVAEALRLNKRNADISVQVENCSILVKPDDLSRIVEELVDNACKFSRHGTPVKVVLSINGTLTVSDEGRGMTPVEIDSIGAFQQFDRKRFEQQGLGLGLVLVQEMAVLYDATFHIASESGRGTQVEIVFPRRSGQLEVKSEEAIPKFVSVLS